MGDFSSFDQMLSFAGGKIANFSNEFVKRHQNLPAGEFKTMTTELKKTKKNLAQALQGSESPEYDHKLLKSIMSYITKIKNSTSDATPKEAKRSQKTIFLEALTDLQDLLKDLNKKKKIGSTKLISRVKAKSIVKIEGIGSKGTPSSDKDLNRHLTGAEFKLTLLHREVSKGSSQIKPTQLKEVTTVLKKANVALVKAKAMHKQLSGQYNPDYNRKTLKKIMQEIAFLQNSISEQVKAGAAQMQSNLFWYTLREFQTLLQDLEELKKVRGKQVAKVETGLNT